MVHAVCRPSEQITAQDTLQGLVLLGLLIAQASGWLVLPQLGHRLLLNDHHPDLPVHFVVQLLVRGQFERMGSFLFGLGLYRCWQRANLAGLDAHRLIQRLLVGLLGIGLLLSLLVGSLDMLAQFALLGFTLLYFLNQSVSALLGWLVSLAGLAMLVPSSVGLLNSDPLNSYGLIGWQPVWEWLLSCRSVSQGFSTTLSYELLMLGGLLVGKLGLSHRNLRLRVRLSLLLVGVLPTAFLLKGTWVALTLGLVTLPQRIVTYQPVLLVLSGFLGSLLLTGVYLLDVGLNIQLPFSRWARWFGWIGQLSVSNYVLQSTLCALLLYGYRIAVPSPLPVWGRAVIVVGIYSVQLSFSWLWGKHHQRGPLEWLGCQWIVSKSGSSNSVTTAKL